MRYLRKRPDSAVVARELAYPKDTREIRELLLEEQHGFCAYSEKFVAPTDETHLEHFDPRLKNTERDGYANWYAVRAWMNSHKPKKLAPYLPWLSPDSDLTARIAYDVLADIFVPKHKGDQEAQNLINFLGWNKYALCRERRAHVERIRVALTNPLSKWDDLRPDPAYRSFATALEAHLEIDATPP